MLKPALMGLLIPSWHHGAERSPKNLSLRIPKEPFGNDIPRDNLAIAIRQYDPVRCSVDNLPKLLFTRAQSMLGTVHLERQFPCINGLTKNDFELIGVIKLREVGSGASAECFHRVAVLYGCGEDNDW